MIRFFSLSLSALAALAMTAQGAHALDIVTAPDKHVFVNDANPGKGYYDVMIGTILLRNDEAEAATLKGLHIDVLGGEGEIISKSLPVSDVVAKTREFAGMTQQGLGVFLNSQVLNEGGPSAVFGDETRFAGSPQLGSGDMLIATAQYFAADFAPRAIAITAVYEDGAGRINSVRHDLAVKRREQKIDYIAPLDGAWLMRAFPNLFSHHRFIPSNEFALDFFKTGPDGALDRGERLSGDDDYGYGEPVRAVADGEVVFVISGETQNADALTRREGENVSDAQARITQYQFSRFIEDIRSAAAGNLVVIKHEQDGQTEYSSYGHLASGSVKVKTGDRVRQGDVIASVGNTGDSTLTHLHFQLNAGPDPFFSQSLPVTFSNARPAYIGQDPGLFMQFE
ncbi:M23 family metallopeptidase [Hyphococcus flavus]|uniref:M23 family metallopeptidase n=1 Tax=Hyphococcus flavus TaxID=1866326 RepID=A0AAF0CBZ6_9PROT|nr:M23 family metallopeptidase [Hyphococcus flavus]WDI32215.1 M23 family metallopeptidase [Hyphococcus flavus]